MRLVLCAVYLFIGALVYAIPNMTRRDLLFAVPVPPEFRETPEGRHAISTFRTNVGVAMVAGLCALLLSPARFLTATMAGVWLAIFLTGGISFYWQNRSLAPLAVQFRRSREVELTATPEELPRFAWLAAGPFVILGAAAEFLNLNWSRIPGRFPIHWSASGQPDRWVERTMKGVYGPLFLGVELCAWFLIMALAGWFGSRRSRSRPVMLGGMIAGQYVIGLLFALIAVHPLLGMPAWLVVLAPMGILIPLIIVLIGKLSEAVGPIDPTPNECWKGAAFYYNPNDAALFVEKRDGWGYTLNFANPWSWALLLLLALAIASAPFVLP